jgi:hypothetical protein
MFPHMKRYYWDKVNWYFPKLREEAHEDGMAAFLEESAIDINFIVNEDHRRRRRNSILDDADSSHSTPAEHVEG